jgi:anti-sigma B factor antagonist
MFELLEDRRSARVYRVRARILDSDAAPRFREQSGDLGLTHPMILDLSGVEFADSSGIGCILRLQRLAVERGGTLSLAGLQPGIRSLFELVQLHRVLDIFDDVEEAFRAVGSEEAGSALAGTDP